jgi:phage terminase small subunit
MGVPKRLTEMQKRFAEIIIFGGPDGPVTGKEAAILAGYSEKRGRQEASELQNPRLSPLVVQYMGGLREERLKKYEVTYAGHVAELARIKEEALKKRSFSSAVNAEVSRGKAAGLYIERKIIKTGKLEDMTEEELESKMKKILDDYSPILEGKVEEVKAKVKEISPTSTQPLQPLKRTGSDQDSTSSTNSFKKHSPKLTQSKENQSG